MACTLKIINSPPAPWPEDPRHWNCVLYVGGGAYLWTPGYIYMVVDDIDKLNSYEKIEWIFYLGTGVYQLSVTADMQILEWWYQEFLYQQFGVPAVLKDNTDYVWNCATNKIEEIAAPEPKFSELKIYSYSKA